MKSENRYREKVWKYLQGDMSSEENRQFEEELLRNQELAYIFEEEQAIFHSLGKTEVIELRKQLHEIISGQKPDRNFSGRYYFRKEWMIAAASFAALLLVSLILLFFTRSHPSQDKELSAETDITDTNQSGIGFSETSLNTSIYYRSGEMLMVNDTNDGQDLGRLLLALVCEENPMLENRITLTYRTENIEIIAPRIGQEFHAGNKVRFVWNISVPEQLSLQILNNRAVTVFEKEMHSSMFELSRPLNQGIYYWRFKTKSSVVYNGKFIIR
jgi:hypothetical protein